MAKMTRCAYCGGESPADARFCIDCSASLAPAAIGETTRLPGMRCPGCGSGTPEQARFCVVCGRGLAAGTAPQPQPQPQPQPVPWQRPSAGGPAPIGAPPHSLRQHSYPRVAPAPTPISVGPRRSHRPCFRPGGLSGLGPLLFLVGVFVLLMSGTIWPGILWLIALSGIISAVVAGRGDKALTILVWAVGLTLLFAHGTFWPGILLLVFLSIMINGRGRSSGWW